MAIGTGGTTAATSLTALRHAGSLTLPNGTVLSFAEVDADVATINNGIKSDGVFSPNAPMLGYSRQGQLYVPNRGWLKCFPGDAILIDPTTGWPVLVASTALSGGAWSTTAT